eukprot:12095681-Alexandrium_andersonii.AAC.1
MLVVCSLRGGLGRAQQDEHAIRRPKGATGQEQVADPQAQKLARPKDAAKADAEEQGERPSPGEHGE